MFTPDAHFLLRKKVRIFHGKNGQIALFGAVEFCREYQ